ncbi:MAG TPA: helix-turn-helix domain-containing protein [Planctomycetota bacterium]|nr:helix-turn-helix domain-containing protein [Planctomycetota bacterium]
MIADPQARSALAHRVKLVRTARHGKRGASKFARELDVKGSTYHYYERGTFQPPYELLVRIAELTGCGLVWLTTGFGMMGEADDPVAALAVAEAAERYGPEASMEAIRDETLAIVLNKLHSTEQLLQESRQREETLALRVQQLEQKMKQWENKE